jgi:beta-glucosidase
MRIGAEPAYEPEQAMEEAVALAKTSDIAIVVCGLNQDWVSLSHYAVIRGRS